jgi:hypothetical protein
MTDRVKEHWISQEKKEGKYSNHEVVEADLIVL